MARLAEISVAKISHSESNVGETDDELSIDELASCYGRLYDQYLYQ